jgi:hypothetical protein
VWAGIVGDCLVRRHVLPHRLAGNQYQDFLLLDLPKLLEDVPLLVISRMWYMHDGAPAHFLSNTYHDRWTGRGGPTAWPPRSPDLNPLDLYLWGHVKTFMYAAPVDNEEDFTNALWMPVRVSASTPASLNGCGGP